MLRLVSPKLPGCGCPTRADDATGNAQGNIILFEPSTSEHLSARTIFDPITALAPASDCRTFAIGYVRLGQWQSFTNHVKLPQWLDSHCDTATFLYHSAHPHHPQNPFPYCGPSLAWVLLKAEV